MNERIKQLALQAGLVRNGDFGMKRWEGPLSDSINDRDLEKFAELIVKECVGILSANENTKIKMGLDEPLFKLFKGIGKAYADGIKEHFGVEE